MASGNASNSLTDRHNESYEDTGNELSISITLGSGNAVTTVNIPDLAKGVKIWPNTNVAKFAINRTVATNATSSSSTVATTALGIGGFAKNDQWEVRLLPAGLSRTLTLLSATGSTVVDVEFF